MKVVMLTFIPSPYRVVVFNELAKRFGESFIVLYCAEAHPKLKWKDTAFQHSHLFLKERALLINGHVIPRNPGVFKTLRNVKPDVIITCGFSPTMLKAILYAYLYGVKRMVNTDAWEINEKRYSIFHIWLRKFLYKFTHAFIPVSEKGAQNFQKKYRIERKKIFISPYAVNNNQSRSFAKTSHQYDIMFSGQMIPRKMPDFFCDIVEKLHSERPGLKVLVIGSGTMKEKMLYRMDKCGVDYHYPGFIQPDNLPQYYASARILLFPTLLDSWGVVANDACAVGTPVITCDNAGAANELVVHDYNGFVLPLEVASWVEHIHNLLDNLELYSLFSENALKQIELYSPEAGANGLISAIKSLNQSH